MNIDLLLRQDAWLRRLARHLVSDPDLAEDLVQDAWVAGLEGSRVDEESRPWLAGVLRNRGRAIFRATTRRRARETEVAQLDGVSPATDEVVSNLQLRQRAAEALLRLEEPQRSAVYWVYVMGVPLREAAERMEVAPSTASGRVKRGIESLRLELDDSYGGDRKAWATLLAPLAGRVSATTKVAAGIGVAAVLMGGVWGAASLVAGAGATPVATTDLEPVSTAAMVAATVAPLELASAERVAATPMGIPSAPAAVAKGPAVIAVAEASDGEVATLSGRVLLPDGAGAQGVTVSLRGVEANEERVRAYGLPDDWEDLSVLTEPSGEFSISCHPPRAYHFYLKIEREGYVTESWHWMQLDPGRTHGLGDVMLREAGEVTGFVVDVEGAPVTGRKWRLHAEEFESAWQAGRRAVHASAVADEDTGEFRLTGLPQGTAQLRLAESSIGWTEPIFVEVRPGEEVEKNVVLSPEHLSLDWVALRVSIATYHTVEKPSPDCMALVRPDGQRLHPHAVLGATSLYRFESVGEGPFRIEVTDPRFEVWTIDNVSQGSNHRVKLMGSAAIRLDVRDVDGHSVQPDSVVADLFKLSSMPRRFQVAGPESWPTDGVIHGVPPGDYRFEVRSGEQISEVVAENVLPGETRVLVVGLRPERFIEGQVVSASGQPIENALIRLVRPAESNDSEESPVLTLSSSSTHPQRCRREVVRTTSNQEGLFQVSAQGTGDFVVLAGPVQGPCVEELVLVEDGGTFEALTLVLNSGGSMTGRVLLPESMKAFRWMVIEWRPGGVRSNQRAKLGADGEFVLSGIRPGTTNVYLVAGETFGVKDATGPEDATWLGEFEIVEGIQAEATFEYDGPLPGSVSILVEGVDALLAGESFVAELCSWSSRKALPPTEQTGEFGPVDVLPGNYGSAFRGGDWIAKGPSFLLQSGEDRVLTVDLALEPGRVRLLVDGTPLVRASVKIQPANFSSIELKRTSDEDGWVEWKLGPGAYSILTISQDISAPFYRGTITWPLPGDAADVELVELN